MFATRLAACSVAGALLAGPAFGQPPKPSEELPAPRPVAEPRQVVVQATCYEMSADLVESIGRALDGKPVPERYEAGACRWTLTPRETGLFDALVRSGKLNGSVDVLSRPQLTLTDGQTGFYQVGQQYPLAGPNRQVNYVDTGIVLRLTPRITTSGEVSVRAESQYSSPNPQPVVLADGTKTTAIDIQTIQVTVDVPDGHTALVGDMVTTKAGGDRKPAYVFWRLTPHVVKPGAPVQVPAK